NTTQASAGKFCVSCGESMTKDCGKCGEPVPLGAKFCAGCGEATGGTQKPPASEEEARSRALAERMSGKATPSSKATSTEGEAKSRALAERMKK
ncbi:MAG: putative amidophosphoribosyltransferase, partial [Myxococcota bacterium]